MQLENENISQKCLVKFAETVDVQIRCDCTKDVDLYGGCREPNTYVHVPDSDILLASSVVFTDKILFFYFANVQF